MLVKTYFTKNNTITYNTLLNTSKNPVTEIFYGDNSFRYSRFIFSFDESRLKALTADKTFSDLSNLKHTLKLTNTNLSSDNGPSLAGKERATSFDLIAFKIKQFWDEGMGYDYGNEILLAGEKVVKYNPSNWIYSQTNIPWIEAGAFSGSSNDIIASQHFDLGNENIEMDITSYVNSILTGETNYGIGLCFTSDLEATSASFAKVVGFFTRNTQTFYVPYIETEYSSRIKDDRNNFYLDKINKLYLYVNVAGNPTNLDVLPSVNIYDNNDNLFSAYTEATQVTKGVYSIDVKVPTTSNYIDSTMFSDVWSGITINGIERPEISLNFALKDNSGYYMIGDSVSEPKKVAISVSGINNGETLMPTDIRKVIISARVPYTLNQRQVIDDIKYRLYVKEGEGEVTVIDFTQIEMSNSYYYFLLDTQSLLPGVYYLDIQVLSNLEVMTLKNKLTFTIPNEANLRNTK
jgi:hypothetical protein